MINKLLEMKIVQFPELINKLGSSDWVKDGLKYLPKDIENEKEVCPFCQELTITKTTTSKHQGIFWRIIQKLRHKFIKGIS